MTPHVRVLIADDDPLVRSGLSMMLAGAEDISVVAEAEDGSEVVTAVNQHRPDVVLMDIRMPRVDGLSATEHLRSRRDPPEIVILTTFDTDDHVLRAVRAGASGFLVKHSAPEEIVAAIRRSATGDPVFSPKVLRTLMSHAADHKADSRHHQARKAFESLTNVERTIARHVSEGRTNAEIAAEMSVSIATVKSYVSRLLAKLEVSNRVKIAMLVHDAQIDPPESSD